MASYGIMRRSRFFLGGMLAVFGIACEKPPGEIRRLVWSSQIQSTTGSWHAANNLFVCSPKVCGEGSRTLYFRYGEDRPCLWWCLQGADMSVLESKRFLLLGDPNRPAGAALLEFMTSDVECTPPESLDPLRREIIEISWDGVSKLEPKQIMGCYGDYAALREVREFVADMLKRHFSRRLAPELDIEAGH